MTNKVFVDWSSDLFGPAGLAVTGPGELPNYGLIMGSVCFIVVVWRRRISLAETAAKWLNPRPQPRAFGPTQRRSLVKVDEPDPVVSPAQSVVDSETKV